MLFPYVETKRTTLRPSRVMDGSVAYAALQEAGIGDLPALEAFTLRHAEALSAQFFVEQRGEVVGLSSLHHLDPHGQHVRADLLLDPERARHGVGMEAVLLTVNYAFAMWNLRKVYFWAEDSSPTGFNENQPMIQLEATLPDHIDTDGVLSDAYIFAVYREQWTQYGYRMLERLVPHPVPEPAPVTDPPVAAHA